MLLALGLIPFLLSLSYFLRRKSMACLLTWPHGVWDHQYLLILSLRLLRLNFKPFVQKTESSDVAKSTPCLLVPWRIASPGHQQPWHLPWKISGSFNGDKFQLRPPNLCCGMIKMCLYSCMSCRLNSARQRVNTLNWHKMKTHIDVSAKHCSTWRVNIWYCPLYDPKDTRNPITFLAAGYDLGVQYDSSHQLLQKLSQA